MNGIGIGCTILAFILLAASCNPFGQVCTLVGCRSGLAVEIVGATPDEYSVSVEVPGAEPPWTIECTKSDPCRSTVFFPEFTPDIVRVRVQAGGSTWSDVFRPTYEVSRPNGPECPPTCRNATVEFELGP